MSISSSVSAIESRAMSTRNTSANWRPSLIVQAVDPEYIPIPGAHVTVKPLSGSAQTISVSTDGDGYAKIFAPEDSEYSVEIKLVGFKNVRVKSVHLGNSTHTPRTAYIQFVMKLSGSGVTVY